MKKTAILLAMAFLGFAGSAFAAVQLNGPLSLFSTQKAVTASSTPIGLFEFSLSQDSGENLVSVGVLVQANASTTITSTDLGALTLYRDNGDGAFNSSTDLVAGSQSSVSIGTTTVVTATSNNSLSSTSSTPTKFFVALSTGPTWSDQLTPDSVTIALVQNGIITSSHSPTSGQVTAPAVVADTTGPRLVSAVAKNTGGSGNKEAGDSIELTFGEATNKIAVSSSSLAALVTVGNSHSLLDTSGNLGTATWNSAGTVLTITLSGSSSTTIPSIALGDTISIAAGTPLADNAGNRASGSVTLTGTFGTPSATPPSIPSVSTCTNGLINGRLYTVNGYMYVYQAASCRLKLFKGKSYYVAQGNKFENVINLSVFPLPGQPIDPPVDTAHAQLKLELSELKKQMRAEIEMVRQKYEEKLETLKVQLDAQAEVKEQEKEGNKSQTAKLKSKIKLNIGKDKHND